MKILLTGASGYVGARLYFDLSKKYNLIGTYATHKISDKLEQLDTTDQRAVGNFVARHMPDIIVHVASQADPRWCEANPEKAVALNQTATTTIVGAADSVGAKVIFMSSFAAFKPINVYAKTKYESEKIVEKTKAGYLVLRPSYILGFSPNTVNDRAFNRLLKNLDHGTPAIYDTSWKFQPTYIGHISEVIAECIDRNIWDKMIPITVPEVSTRYDCARDILNPLGITVSSIDNKDTTPFNPDDLSELVELGLPQYAYRQMIDTIVDEIKHRNIFVI